MYGPMSLGLTCPLQYQGFPITLVRLYALFGALHPLNIRNAVGGGPNFPIANGSVIPSLEATLRYAFEAVRKIQRQNIKSLHPFPAAVEDFQQYKDSIMSDTVWTSSCTSW
jgi:hypothetical protein